MDDEVDTDVIEDIVGGDTPEVNNEVQSNETRNTHKEPTESQDKLTDEDVIIQIQQEALGQKPPNKREFDNNTNTVTVSEVRSRFGSWLNAIEKAGLDPTLADDIDDEDEPFEQDDSSYEGQDQSKFERLDSPPREHDNIFNRRSWPGSGYFNAGEELVMAAPPHWIRSIRQYTSGTILFFIGLFLSIHYLGGWTNDYLMSGNLPFNLKLEATTSYLVGVAFISVIGMVLILWAHIERNHRWYIITDGGVRGVTGVLGTEDLCDFDYRNINNIKQIDPYPLNKLNIGHIKLYTASTDGSEATLRYIKNPSKWKREMKSYMADVDQNPEESGE